MSKSNNMPRYIRYPLIVVIILFFVGILLLKKKVFVGLFFLLIGNFMLIMSIIKFKGVYVYIVRANNR